MESPNVELAQFPILLFAMPAAHRYERAVLLGCFFIKMFVGRLCCFFMFLSSRDR